MYLIKSFTRITVNSHVQPSNEKMLMYWRIEAWCNHSTMPAVLPRLQGTQAQDASQLHLRFYLAILQTCTPIWRSKLVNLINLPFCYVGCFTRLQDTSKRITEHSLRNNHPHSEPIQWKKLLNVECQLWNCAKFPTLKHGNSRYHLSVLFRYLLNKSREHLTLTRKEKTIRAIQIHSKLQKNIDRKGYESLFMARCTCKYAWSAECRHLKQSQQHCFHAGKESSNESRTNVKAYNSRNLFIDPRQVFEEATRAQIQLMWLQPTYKDFACYISKYTIYSLADLQVATQRSSQLPYRI